MVTLAALAAAAYGQAVVEVQAQGATEVGLDAEVFEGPLESAIDEQLKLADPAALMSHFANAGAMAIRGMGVDYASNPKRFSVGGSLGTAVSGVPIAFSRGPQALPEGGFAFMASLYAGMNLGVLVPGDNFLDRLYLYANGLAFSPPGRREFKASLYNVGVHGQVKVIGPLNAKVVEWGGLDVTTGYERAIYSLELSQDFPISQPLAPGTATWTASGNYVIRASAGTVPLELSTNLRVLMFTAYAGGALDVGVGGARSEASLSGPVDATINGQESRIGTASVTIDSEGLADRSAGRLFVGAQVNVLAVKVFGHVNVGSNDSYGGFLGLRVAM